MKTLFRPHFSGLIGEGRWASRLHWVFLWLLWPLLLPAAVYGTTVVPPSFDELVEKADVIFEGEVIAKKSMWAGEKETRRIKTDYTFQVMDILKGTVPAVYTLEVLGGTVGDTTLTVEGAPQFSPGERVLLFVTQNGIQYVPLVGIMHGHYRFQNGEPATPGVVVKHDGQTLRRVEEIGKEEPAGGRLEKMRTQSTPEEILTPQSFKDKIRAKREEQSRR